ncbi:hypothetical protein HNP24_000059 [Chryseobacterium sediminis]|uniref:Uncharacterized protein n=1 Tax=Chryseobacterium sediminis TaxID=1679494 RepID=A0ABR6PU65_9FLAO|nr:hypothetical protein [Chryseobacterium sediminis]
MENLLNLLFEPLRYDEDVKNMKISFALSLRIRMIYLTILYFLNPS